MAKIELRIGSETYRGKTQREANGAALAHLAALVNGDSWAPIVVPAGETTLVGTKWETGEWGYHCFREGRSCGSTIGASTATRALCERAMRRHAAQYLYTPDDNGAASLAVIHNAEDRADHERWIAFQVESTAKIARHI
jgi:hypothetical protein